MTSVGFVQLTSEDYAEAAACLQPDIVIGMGDIAVGRKPGKKRVEKMGDRTSVWTEEMIEALSEERASSVDTDGLDRVPKTQTSALFAPVLPIEEEQQSWYFEQLKDDFRQHISGLAIYGSCPPIGLLDTLRDLPRLYLGEPESPHEVLDCIALGVDVLALPFIGAATDAGIALDISFPFPTDSSRLDSLSKAPRPMGVDMWQPRHAIDPCSLRSGCACYACRVHHRAYVQHLLVAKEMLGWVLLQIHNLQVMDDFFANVRGSISRATFEEDRKAFRMGYCMELPEKTGQGPRYVQYITLLMVLCVKD